MNDILIFFLLRFTQNFQKNFTSASNVWRVGVDEALERLQNQNKTDLKLYNVVFNLIVIVITIKLSSGKKKGLCVLADKSRSVFVQTRIQELANLKLKATVYRDKKSL